MNYTIHIDHSLKIIHYKHSGKASSDDIGHVWDTRLLRMPEFTQLKYNLFADYSDAILDIPAAFIPELVEIMHSIKEIIDGKKQAVLSTHPMSTAVSLMLEKEIPEKTGYNIKVFSTREAAIEWLSEDNQGA